MGPSEKEKMLSGLPYRPGDPALQADMAAAKVWMVRYNAALAESPAVRRALLREQLGAVGEGAVIRPPFHCDYGYNIRLGQGVFLNYNCVILDVAEVSSTPPTIRVIPRRGRKAWSRPGRSGSGAMSGSGAARSCCPASPSAMTRWWARAVWSPATCLRARPWWAIRRGRCLPAATAIDPAQGTASTPGVQW
jgi:hypothetical protein